MWAGHKDYWKKLAPQKQVRSYLRNKLGDFFQVLFNSAFEDNYFILPSAPQSQWATTTTINMWFLLGKDNPALWGLRNLVRPGLGLLPVRSLCICELWV